MNWSNILTASVYVAGVLSCGVAQATVIDSFTNTATGNTVSPSVGDGRWISETYTGVGIYNDSTRLVTARAGHSNGASFSVNPGAGTLSSLSAPGSAFGVDLSYGTGVKNWFDGAWAQQPYGTIPNVSSANRSLQLNISASLSDSLYINAGTADTASISLFDSAGALLGSYGGTFSAGMNTILFSAFSGLSAAEAADIDGITISFGKATLNEVGFNVTSAVPEPEAYAMMLAGLGAIGAATRRRRSK